MHRKTAMRRNKKALGPRRLTCQWLEDRIALDASMLRITEVMAANDETLADFEGDYSDWVEIYNPSTSVVDLTGIHLSDRKTNPTKWEFPAGASIAPGGYLVVFASSKDLVAPNGEYHTNFALSADGEYIGLLDADGVTVIDEILPGFPEQTDDVSFGLSMAPTGVTTTLVGASAQGRAWVPTSSIYDATWTSPSFNDSVFTLVGPTGFGYEQSPGDAVNFTSHIGRTVPAGTTSLYVRIEFDLTTLAGIDQLKLRMKYDDGFVAYLNGVKIADANAPEGAQWNATASGLNDDSAAIVYEDFDVSAAISSLVVGENVLAIHALNISSTSSDFLMSPLLVAEQAVITTPESLGFFDVPTPGYGNGESFAGFTAEPSFSVPHGFYSTTQSVTLTSSTPGATILYTIDGSAPTVNANLVPTNGIVYTGPITVSSTRTIRAIAFKQDFKTSFVNAASYLFLNDIVTQSPLGQTPPGWPASGLNGQEMNYGIDPDIINQYGVQAVKDSLLSIPTITLTTDLANLFNPTTGIYVNAGNRGSNWERLTSVELINPDGSEGFSTTAGLRIRGGYSRGDFNPKHAFRLYFRGEYGDGKLNYPLFDDDGVDEFDVLDLRTAQNYSWSSEGNVQNTFLREVFARDTQADLGQPHTRSNYYHLYLDGQYWGIFMTQERIDENYGESYFGGDASDYDVVKSDLAVSGGTEIADGNDAAWRQLFDLAQQMADSPSRYADNYWTMQGLNSNGTRNTSLPVLLDVDNVVDYMMIIIYTGGYDSGISQFLNNERANNWFGIRNRVTGEQGFQFFLHDNEHSLGAGSSVHGTLGIDRTGPFTSNNDRIFEQFNPQFLHQDLLSHPEYKQKFIDRTQELFFNGGALTVEASIARMLERKEQVDPAIIAEAARWGDSKVGTPRNKSTWLSEVNWLTGTYFTSRVPLVLNQLRADGLFTSFAAPTFTQYGGDVPFGFALGMSAGAGTIYYTTDGETDPRNIGGSLNSSSEVQAYSGPVALTGQTTVWARLRTLSGQWSGLVKATFNVAPGPGDYDGNGFVDNDDNLVWRSTYGSTTDLRADGNSDGVVNAADYTVWRDAYDAALAMATAIATVAPPEYEPFATLAADEASSEETPAAATPVFISSDAIDTVSSSLATPRVSPAVERGRAPLRNQQLLLIEPALAYANSDAALSRYRPTARQDLRTVDAAFESLEESITLTQL